MTRPSWIGYTLSGRYQIEALLGQGGMSSVYRAHDPNLRRMVAIKLIHSHLSSDAEFVRRFESEAAAIAQLRHPNIVQVYDFNHDGDTYYMVMEFLPGESLQDRLKALTAAGKRLPVSQAATLMATVADAVAYAHGRGMIHRDLKPANVMLMSNEQPVLTDFGVAKIVGSKQHTATGAVLGTPMYMSPEQVQGLPQDARTDIYSMGIMLYEMAAGKPPYEGDSAITIMLKQVNEPLPDIRARVADVPLALKSLVDRALVKQPEGRFQTAAEFAAALRSMDLAASKPANQPTVAVADEEATEVDPAAKADRTMLGDASVMEQTMPPPRPATPQPRPAPPPEPRPQLRPARPPEAPPLPRPQPGQSGTIVVPQPDRPRERAGWEHEPVRPQPLPTPKRSPVGLLVGVGIILLVCLVGTGLLAVLGGPAIMNALFGSATQATSEAGPTATKPPSGQTPVLGTDAATEAEPTDVPTEAPTKAPTEVPTETPTPEPTAIPVPEGMVLLPGGTFDMGSGTGDAAPVHRVTLDPFFLDQFEVTNARYQVCVDSGACTRPVRTSSDTRGGYFTNPEFAQFPVLNVTWDQAQTFCAAQGLRLPTEAEWEFAASSGRGLDYPWGDQFDPNRTTVSDRDTRRVGSFSNGSSEQGVSDLAGNALEWVADWYQSDYYAESPEVNPPGPNSGGEKVLRGGSFGNPDPTAYLSTRRFRRGPLAADVDIGFRCAGSVP